MVTLYNVIDTRSGKKHSKAVVSERNAKWFVPADPEPEVVEEGEEE